MTRRRFSGDRLVVASHNPGKVREIADLVRPLGIDTVSAAQLALPEPEETGTSFTENAELKARSAALGADMPGLADDSGLVVPALGGAPGIYSARWAGPAKDFQAAMQKLHEALGDKDPAAHFICVLSLAWPDGHVESVSGRVDGRLVWPPRGTRGFGYDPVFVAEGETATFGELDPARKHAMSHRADAFRQLMAACFSPA